MIFLCIVLTFLNERKWNWIPDGSTDYYNKVSLKEYDLPRELYERKIWLMRWRTAWFQCLYPKNQINMHLCFYDKRTGLDLGLKSVLTRLISAKRMVTKIRKLITDYESKRATELIWEKEYDTNYQNALSKLERYIKQRDALQKKVNDSIAAKTSFHRKAS